MDAASSFLLLGFEGDLFITLGLGSGAVSYDHQWPCGMWPNGMWDNDCAAQPTSGVGRKDRGRSKHKARIYLREENDKRDVAEFIKAKLRERYPDRVVPEPKPKADDAGRIAEIAARNSEIERRTEISRIERQKSDDADILVLIMLGMQ